MKKMLVAMVAFAIAMWMGVSFMLTNDVALTDEELAYRYMVLEYGEGDYDIVLLESDDDAYISFVGYSDGDEAGRSVTALKSWCQNRRF